MQQQSPSFFSLKIAVVLALRGGSGNAQEVKVMLSSSRLVSVFCVLLVLATFMARVARLCNTIQKFLSVSYDFAF